MIITEILKIILIVTVNIIMLTNDITILYRLMLHSKITYNQCIELHVPLFTLTTPYKKEAGSTLKKISKIANKKPQEMAIISPLDQRDKLNNTLRSIIKKNTPLGFNASFAKRINGTHSHYD
ncbi:hypothetical protein AAY77_10785 [Providencia rettgeri]|nr:hypothetical protein AAY77_10785 [Providencia rettgeri]